MAIIELEVMLFRRRRRRRETMMIGKEISCILVPTCIWSNRAREGGADHNLSPFPAYSEEAPLPPLYSGSTIRTFNTSCSLLHCDVYAGRRHTRVTEKPSASESSGPGNENSKSRVGGTCVSVPDCTCTRLGRVGGLECAIRTLLCATSHCLDEVTLAQLQVY